VSVNSLWQDFRFGARMLAKAPGFTAVAVLTLALGIGANTSIFTVANALMLRPLPYSDPGRIALIFGSRADQPGQFQPFSHPRFTLIRDQNRSFSGIAALANENFNFTGRGTPEQLTGARVTWNFFDVLGVRPALGRAFLADEGRPEGKEVVLISQEMWAHRFGSDKGIIGQSITLDSRSYTVVGVLPAGFSFAYLGAAIDVWVPREFELNLLTKVQFKDGAAYLNPVSCLLP